MFATDLQLHDTKSSKVKEIFLNGNKLGFLDTRDEGTFLTKRKKSRYRTQVLGINKILLETNIISFENISIEFQGVRYITTTEFLIVHGRQYHTYKGDEIGMPRSKYLVQEIQFSLFRNYEEVE